MNYYLIVLQAKGDYYSAEYEELWLPTTTEEIESALNRLGCRLVLPNYRITYAKFGYPEIDRMAYDSDILALNRLATLLQDYKGRPDTLCAELVYKECKDIYDVLKHLEHRPKLIVTPFTDILAAGENIVATDYYDNDEINENMTYEEYERKLYYENGCSLPHCYIKNVMESMRCTYFRFTPYGVVYEDPEEMLPF